MNLIKRLQSKLGFGKATPGAHLVDSKVFCMAPWVQLHSQTNGKMAPCCIAAMYDGNEIGNLQIDSDLRNAWNSPNMKQLRRNMSEGKESTLCINCYNYEKHGKFSERMQYNQDFKQYYSRVVSMLRDGTVIDHKVPILDIRFSNKCNYKCRICNSSYSSMWYEEQLKMGELSADSPKEMKTAADEALFWESFKSLLPYAERIHFAGGEPLFMEEHYEVLEYLVSIEKTDVLLTYNTNFSTLRYKKYNAIDLWKKFKRVDIWASLDAMGEQGDYQRKGQKWEDIENNIRTLQRECPDILFGICVSVSIFNVFRITEFYKYLVENKLVQPDRVNLYLVFGPKQFSVTNLPESIKVEVVKKFEDFENSYLTTIENTDKIQEHMRSVISYMLSEKSSEGELLKQSINKVDRVRNENFTSTFPELSDIMHLAEEDTKD